LQSILKFFLTHGRLNYVIMAFISLLGVFSYLMMPKDVFPPIQLDKIMVSGGYAGTSVDILDKMTVTKIEDELRSLDGIAEMQSSIKNSSFSIILTLEDGTDIDDTLNDVKDVISNVKRYFPSDMNEPTAKKMKLQIPILAVVVSSNTETMDSMIRIGKDIKREILSISGVSNVNLYAESDRVLEIKLDSKKIEMFGLNKGLLIQQLQKFSYIYPAGKLEETGKHLFVSTLNGERSAEEILNIRIPVAGQTILLKDIAMIEQKYKEIDIISRFNGERNIELGVSKNESGDAIALAENVKKRLEELQKKYPTVNLDTYNDASKIVRNRLNTVVSSIFVGLILVSLTVFILVNARVSFVVTIGIPTTFLIGAFVIYVLGYSINIMTLLGVLLILGVLVDDAIIVAENIQRHIHEGEEKLHSAIVGTKEVLVPVLASSLTTIFAFFPMMALTNEMGEFLKMIPVAIVVLIFASIIESFVFLPLHSLHAFKKGDKELDWSPVNKMYKKFLHLNIRFKWVFIIVFPIGVMVATVLLLSTMKYQLFPDFDSDKMFIRGSFTVDHSVEDTAEKLRLIENDLLQMQDELQIKSISLLAGFKNTTLGFFERKPNVFEFNIELHNKVPQNFIDEYITPYLAPNYDPSGRIREIDVSEIVQRIKDHFAELKIDGMEELLIIRDRPAVTNYDIEIQVNHSDEVVLRSSIAEVEKKFAKINGIITYGNDAKDGIKEIKLYPNSYGESLGFTEASLAMAISPFFLEIEQGRGLGNEGIVEVITREENLESRELLENFEIATPDGTRFVKLKEVANLKPFRGFDSIYKEHGLSVKTIYANVDNTVITASEALAIIEPTLAELRKNGVAVNLKGEQEQNQQMQRELSTAFVVAIFLIFITLLIMFNSFRATFIILSVIPLSVFGAVVGHIIIGSNFAMPSVIGIMGLAGVVINNGVVMLDFIRKSHSIDEVLERASLRLRPILITSITTFVGLSTLIFFATGQAVILQPIAISLGFGLLWGTVLNLIYLPVLFVILNQRRLNS
jgi:HAE1 family hydrophobic/amphiphilic exporter-1